LLSKTQPMKKGPTKRVNKKVMQVNLSEFSHHK